MSNLFNKNREVARKKSAKLGRLEELVLPNAKLKFCPEQLQNLNYIINNKLQQDLLTEKEKSLSLAKSVSERLVQRLICGAGMLDPRFSSKYLITYNQHEVNNNQSNKLHYIVRLDSLSLPTLYNSDPKPKYSISESECEYPAGYARIKLHTSTYKVWGDFTNSQGFFRRDKVQARLVELLASAASKEVPSSPLYVDESLLCGIPGKVVDAYTLHNILKVPSIQHVYYGPGGNVPRFPDPRDFRLAIVDEPGGIRIKIEFLSPALSNITIDVTILVGIGVDYWPSSTDFPGRLSLGHPDCLLYHQAALTGMYLVGYGVHSSAWQIRMPAAEQVILSHYGENSTVKTILDMLYLILEDIDSNRRFRRSHVSYKILSKYIMLTALLEELEENSISPLSDMIYWSPLYLSTHLLKILDKTVIKLCSEKQPNYFFKKSNLLVNPGHWSDDDFIIEANNVKNVMAKLFDESLMSTKGNEDFSRVMQAQENEMILLFKWRELVEGLLPPPGTRGRRFCFAGSKTRREVAHSQYTMRQLEYIGMLLNKMLMVKQNIMQFDHNAMENLLDSQNYHQDHPLEDIIFILVTIMDQARDQYLSNATNPAIIKNRLKIKSNFNNHTSKLVDFMRKDKELLSLVTFEDDLSLVKTILKWLYRGMDQSKRCLGPILRPYLNNIFSTSHAIAWHLESIKERLNNDEMDALGSFAQLINTGKITPAQGLIDSVNKNWNWAKSMLNMVEKNTLRVVFISDKGQVYRHILSLPSYQRKTSLQSESQTLERRHVKKSLSRQKTLPNRSYFNSLLKERMDTDGNDIPQHERLKNFSSLNYIIDKRHRRGEHRGAGDIFKALASMQKLSMFQDVASNLPAEERLEILELIQNIQTAKARRSLAKRWSGTLPQPNQNQISKSLAKNEAVQKYTPKEESAGIRLRNKDPKEKVTKEVVRKTSVLLESCRAARIKEDSGVFYLNSSFKINSLLSKSNSFKY